MYDHKKPKHGIRKLLWLAKIGDRICINLKKTIIAKPVQIIPKTVAEKKLFKLTFLDMNIFLLTTASIGIDLLEIIKDQIPVAEKKLFKLTEPTYWEKVTLDKP